ncbi:MAG: hypothetical protein MI700_12755 [Balneolales bacterium]|nr:hypothetical protein [Balneolales bacterium]
MRKKIYLLISITACLFYFGCSNSDAQVEFENQAYSIPQNITETDFQGNIVRPDSDDWRISPVYVGLAEIEFPAFPNPVDWGNSFEFTVDLRGAISSFVEVYYFNTTFAEVPQFLDRQNITGDFENLVFRLDTEQFGGADRARGIHRILIFDGNQRMISYGDLLIE